MAAYPTVRTVRGDGMGKRAWGNPVTRPVPIQRAGVALHDLRRMLGGTSYGIELDRERAEAAARILDHVLAGDYSAMRLPAAVSWRSWRAKW